MDQMACLWRDSQATVALPTPVCETGPQHLSTAPQAFGGESAASLVRTSVGPGSNQKHPQEEGSKLALFGLVSNQGGRHTAGVSAVLCSSKATSDCFLPHFSISSY